MINVKGEIYGALKSISGLDETNVTDIWPEELTSYPSICYIEEENKVYEATNGSEDESYVRFKIDVFNDRSTSDLALAIDEKISAFGLKRIQCVDLTDVKGIRHKCIRYEGIIDNETEQVYTNN